MYILPPPSSPLPRLRSCDAPPGPTRRSSLPQRVRDWMYDFFSSLPKLCEDPNDVVSAAAFSAIEELLRGHPLCVTAVDRELESFWGVEGEHQQQQRWRSGVERGGDGGGGGAAGGGICGHKQVRNVQEGFLVGMCFRSNTPSMLYVCCVRFIFGNPGWPEVPECLG